MANTIQWYKVQCYVSRWQWCSPRGQALASGRLEANFYGLGLGTYGRGIALRLKGPGSKAQVWPWGALRPSFMALALGPWFWDLWPYPCRLPRRTRSWPWGALRPNFAALALGSMALAFGLMALALLLASMVQAIAANVQASRQTVLFARSCSWSFTCVWQYSSHDSHFFRIFVLQ